MPLRAAIARRTAAVAAAALAAVAATAVLWQGDRDAVSDTPAVLAAKAAAQGVWDIPWDLHERKAASLMAQAAVERDPGHRLLLQREAAIEHLNGGAPEAAIALLESLLRGRGDLPAEDVEVLEADLAFAYFRVGEQGNCVAGVDASTCIVPFDADAAHRHKLGASAAADRYLALLEKGPHRADDAYAYRWMLHLATSQAGRPPASVPRRWRIDASVFDSDGTVGRFKEVAASRGIVETGRAGGTVLEDFDNDGHLDLLLSHMGMDEPLALFRNIGDGSFVRADAARAGLRGLYGGLNLLQADYDNDGCIDVYVPRGAWYHDSGRLPSSLLRGHCDGTFTDVGARAGVLNELPTQSAAWADFDGDGWLDLFVGNEIVRDRVAWPAATPGFRLYVNRRDGTFADRGTASGIAVDGMIKGVAVDDVDGDGRPDLYLSIMGRPNRLYRNLGGSPPRFADVTDRAGVAAPVMSFTTWFFDVDNDGCPDLFVSGYSATVSQVVKEMLGDGANAHGERARLYRNRCDGTFVDASREMRLDRLLLTMGGNFGDLDNDGWLDLYLGTGAAPLAQVVPNQMFRNASGRRFENVTTAGGFGHLQKGHGVAFGDIDNRGAHDVVINTGGAMGGDRSQTLLFRNPSVSNHWVKLDLTGVQSNRYAVGARVRLRVTDPDHGRRDIVRTVGSGGSFGASPLRPHVGIGAATSVDAIEVRWPGSGEVQRWLGPFAADARYRLRQGDDRVGRSGPVPSPQRLQAPTAGTAGVLPRGS